MEIDLKGQRREILRSEPFEVAAGLSSKTRAKAALVQMMRLSPEEVSNRTTALKVIRYKRKALYKSLNSTSMLRALSLETLRWENFKGSTLEGLRGLFSSRLWNE